MLKPRRTVFLLTALATLFVGLVGCSSSEGVEKGDVAVDDVTGCPVLSGRYAVAAPDRNTGVSLEGSAWTTGERSGLLSRYAAVEVKSMGTHAVEMRFAYPFLQVMASLDQIREYERPRYAEFYRLMQPEPRAAYVAANGEAALRSRIAALGPRTADVVSFERNRDYTCEDGWMLFPRSNLGPVRMTIDASGALGFESKELSAFEVTVWCGDGCKGFPIPTGSYIGTMRWPAEDSEPEWNADDVARGFVFLRPIDEVEAEQKVFAENNRRHAEAIYATPQQVREALTPLLAEGVAIADVSIASLPFKGPRVRVLAVPSDPTMPGEQQRQRLEWFLAALRDGDPSHIEDSEVVKRGTVGDGEVRYEYEIYLDTHPSVQPRSVQSTAAVTFVPPPALPTPVQAKPEGFLPLDDLEARLSPHVVSGCTIEQLGYSGGAVVIKGRAATMQCVSDSMRALDGAVPMGADGRGSGIELVQIAAGDAGYTFEIRLPESPLTKE